MMLHSSAAAAAAPESESKPTVVSIDFVGGTSGNFPEAMQPSAAAGVVPSRNWNNAFGSAGVLRNTIDADGDYTGVSVAWQGDGTWATAIAPGDGDAGIMKGYLDIYATHPGGVEVSGLTFDRYDVIVYHDGANGSTSRSAIYTIGDDSRAIVDGQDPVDFSGQMVDGRFFTRFSGLTGPGFQLKIAASTSTDAFPRAPLNGLQIVGTGAQHAPASVALPPLSIASPNGRLQAAFTVDPASGQLSVALTRDGHTVLRPSPLGVNIDGVDLGGAISSASASPLTSADEVFPRLDLKTDGRSHYQTRRYTFLRSGAGDQAFTLEVRMFDDGFAYRYRIPGSGPRKISGEPTAWTLPDGAQVWYQSATGADAYEGVVESSQIGAFDSEIGAPLTARLPDEAGYLAISEAGFQGYSGMSMRAAKGSTTLRARFADDATWDVAGGAYSSWRVVLATPDLNGLVTSDVIQSLAPPPDPTLFRDRSWIKPGRATWSWWDRNGQGDSGGDFAKQKLYVDFAKRLGFEYVTVDAGWEQGFPAEGRDQWAKLAELVGEGQGDGATHPVGIWVWKYWEQILDDGARAAFFDHVAAAGAVGVKIDFLNSDSAERLRFYEDCLKDAAARRLMINFHGANKPAGERRTYPNEMTREAVYGLEQNTFGRPAPAIHNVRLVFTRLLAGPADYTPVTFQAQRLGDTTFAHQLATAGVFTSPLTNWADYPGRYLEMTDILDILTAIPATWDETLVLPGSDPDRFAAMARRTGDDWFVFVISGASGPIDLAGLDLGFLGSGRFDAVILTDATRTSFARRQMTVSAGGQLAGRVLPKGGAVVRLSRSE
jgi:alpha-glucosidase